ncbi:hypothetical protein I317_07767 [Kwoniella heveanensis CBS 569]|nr:hypothetical protein I317_07767 [Kwoniella heveanensis CBS 569]
MLTTSTSSRSQSGLTGDSASLSASVDLEIVEEIFSRGRNATSFPQIFRPYTEVLQEHGISPTGDSTYYNFLLKVGVIKAPTWGDKWSLWKATHSPYTSTLPLDDDDHRKTRSRSYHSSLTDVKSRVPFLASASSDLDEGFADESAHDQGDEARSEIIAGRPSPRKEMGRTRGRDLDRVIRSRSSLVGYTPDHSFERNRDRINEQEDDLSSFMPPIRTSTPIFAQTPAYRFVNPPAYSVSDVSQALDQATEEFSALCSGMVTPTGKRADLPANYYTLAAPSQATWVDRIDDLPEHVRRRMEVRADEFYEMGLMGRCWDMWFKTSEFYRVTYKNIPIARDNLLVRQVLEKWSRATHYQLTLPNTADKHRSHHLKSLVLKRWIDKLKERELDCIEQRWTEKRNKQRTSGIWREWRDKAQRRRTERWKLDMAEREIRFTEKRAQKTLHETLLVTQYWRVEARSRLAGADARQRKVGETFSTWHSLAGQQCELRTRLQVVERKKVKQAFAIWQRRTIHAPRERQLLRLQGQRLMRRVWDDWRISCWQKQQSSTFDRRRLLLTGLDRWRARYRQVKVSERKAKIFDNTRLMDTAFKEWKLESWGRLLLQAREKRLGERVWARWKEGMSRLDDLEARASSFVTQSNSNRAQTLFSHWRSLAASHQTSHLRARLIHERKLKASALSKWRSSTTTIRDNMVMADKAHAFFLLRTAFKAWRGESAKLTAKRWVENRQHQLVKRVFDDWRDLTVRYQDLEHRELVIKNIMDKRMMGRLLNRWTERVIEVKDREIRVSRASDERSTKNALSRWQAKLAIVQANQKKANDSLEIRELENLRRVFRFWRGRMKRQKRLRAMVESSIVERERRLVQGVFGRWYERKRERELDEIRNEVAFLHENVVLYGVMDRWKAATEILPGITADSIRLKRRTIDRWLTALERRRKANQMQRERDLRLLSEAFILWREAANHKSTLKARRIRNRSRPSTNVLGQGSTEDSRTPQLRTTSSSTTRRIPSTSTIGSSYNLATATVDDRNRDRRRRISGSGSGIGIGSKSPGLLRELELDHYHQGRSETVYSEPVYSRLRSELADRGDEALRRRRGGSEEVDERAAMAGPAVIDHQQPHYVGRRRWSRALGLREGEGVDGGGGSGGGGGGGGGGGVPAGGMRLHRVTSGSEMLRALRGSIPGR